MDYKKYLGREFPRFWKKIERCQAVERIEIVDYTPLVGGNVVQCRLKAGHDGHHIATFRTKVSWQEF